MTSDAVLKHKSQDKKPKSHIAIMAARQMYYKYQVCFIADTTQTLGHGPELVIIMSEKTYDNYCRCEDDCVTFYKEMKENATTYHPSAQVIKSYNKEALERVYEKNKRGELTSYGEDVIVEINGVIDITDEQEDILLKMCPKWEVVPTLEDILACGC